MPSSATSVRTIAPRPPSRRLRVYAFDPSAAAQLDTATINRLTLAVPWEVDPRTGQDVLAPGPVGEYVEIIDVDPASGAFYPPVDLNNARLLGQDGVAPSEGNPQFHQQMVYAVAMTTIRNFERALGRCALWRGRASKWYASRFVRRLRIYPHALRDANAFYSPVKQALLFGYFPASATDPGRNLPGGTVFTCLSHEIIAHETTHALLDGMQEEFITGSNPDVHALHEALADLVALFQHFSFPEVLRHQIASTRGDLAQENLLAKLAVQFGEATGRYGALRDAIGSIDSKEGWQPRKPDPGELGKRHEPHERGAILVAALFDAFVAIYRLRTADLLRIATGGSGVLPHGELHPDLVNRLAGEAAKTANHFLRMAIRAVDYCPPVDVTFGDYLRALITADYDLVPNDDLGYRVAVIESCRRRGIYPELARSLAVDSIRWQDPVVANYRADYERLIELLKAARDVRSKRGRAGTTASEEAAGFETPGGRGAIFRQIQPDWGLSSDRQGVYDQVKEVAQILESWLRWAQNDPQEGTKLEAIGRAMGLELGRGAPPTVERDADGLPRFRVQTVRPARRQGPDGEVLVDLVVQLTQSRRGYLDGATQERVDQGETTRMPRQDFEFKGGCTLLIDLAQDRIRYCIGKGVASSARLDRQRQFLKATARRQLAQEAAGDAAPPYPVAVAEGEPFALLHEVFSGRESPR